MGKIFTGLILFFAFSAAVFSQSQLYMPLNFQEAYSNGTRSEDGRPGIDYWQNHSDYKISASIDPSLRKLNGTEHIEYYNDSPDSLKRLVIRLYQDMNKPTSARNGEMNKETFTNGDEIEELSINGQSVDISDRETVSHFGTNMNIKLTNPVLPGESVSISVKWNFIIPKVPNPRMGAYDSTTYMIAYWYPQMAVYDDIDGWDMISYTGQVEFYNDFSNYDVEITVPNNMCVWATGVIQNPNDVYSPSVLAKYTTALESDNVINIITNDDYSEGKVLFNASNSSNTWHYKAENVTDFVFACSDKYLWDAVSVEVEPGRRILTGAAYNPNSQDFYEVAQIAHDVILSLSKDLPGVPYPYPRETIFNGSGGMEFPMMVNDGSTKRKSSTVNVTSHEITHTYFPFYMGINERKYAWMDEGMAQFLPEEIQNKLADSNDTHASDISRYVRTAGSDNDMPMMIPSNNLSGIPYGNASYFRPAAAYNTLRDMLGKEMFDKCLHEYMSRWHGKHPVPYDFFYTFENVTGQDLSWFWQPWFFDYAYPDLSIDTVIVSANKIKVLVSMIGSVPIPVQLTFKASDGTENIVYRTADIWKDGEESIWLEENTNGKKIKSITLGSPHIPDVDKDNNVYMVK